MVILNTASDLSGVLESPKPRHEMERHIDPRRYTCRSYNVAIVHKSIVGAYLDCRINLGEMA